MAATRINPNTNPMSITTLSVSLAFIRAITFDYNYLFNKQELALARHFFFTAKQSLAGFNWLLSETISQLPFYIQQPLFNTIVARGYDLMIMLRKKMIEEKIKEAIANGVTEIVFFGGGIDIRALIVALNNPLVNVYDLDQGLTWEAKVKGIKAIPKEIELGALQIQECEDRTIIINGNYKCIKCNITRDDFLAILKSHGFDKENKKVLYIAEGFTMYLSEDEIHQFLTTCKDACKDSDELLLSFMSKLISGTTQDSSLNRSRESLRFALPPQEVMPFVEKSGCSVVKKFDATGLFAQIGEAALAALYADNPTKPREYYYLLKKSAPELQKIATIEGVADIQFEMPKKPVRQELRH